MANIRDYEILNSLPAAPLDTDVLVSAFANYASPHDKVSQLVRQGLLQRIRRGLYVTSLSNRYPAESRLLVANHLYGPSYISLETALSRYGFIPEHVYAVQSMSTKRSRSFSTVFGQYDYFSCPRSYYSAGIVSQAEGEGTIVIASPEKAVADVVVGAKGIRLQSSKAMRIFLEEDIRIDRGDLAGLDKGLLQSIADRGYKKRELELLLSVVRGG